MVTPFGPRPAWVRRHLTETGASAPGTVAGESGASAPGTVAGGAGASAPAAKEFARCLIAGRVLTVPVEGGANVLKRKDADPALSEHGKWRREHLGAWQAAYGRTPFYQHLMPEIAAVYARSEGMTLEQFNSEMLKVALKWIDPEAASAVRNAAPGSELALVREETEKEVREDLSIFDAIFRLGKRVSLAL